MIDETPYIDDLQKTFYKTMLEARKQLLLDFSYKKVMEMNVDLEPGLELRGPKL